MKINFYGRYNKGTKNELLAFSVNEDCDVHEYLIYDSTFDGTGELSNLLPHMYRFPSQKVTKGSYIYLYIHSFGDRKPIDEKKDKNQVFRFSWGLDKEMSVFNKEKDFLHIAEVKSTSVQVLDK